MIHAALKSCTAGQNLSLSLCPFPYPLFPALQNKSFQVSPSGQISHFRLTQTIIKSLLSHQHTAPIGMGWKMINVWPPSALSPPFAKGFHSLTKDPWRAHCNPSRENDTGAKFPALYSIRITWSLLQCVHPIMLRTNAVGNEKSWNQLRHLAHLMFPYC